MTHSTDSKWLDTDLAPALSESSESWKALAGAKLFITGGTGFFGSWLLESLVRANQRLNLGATAVVLTRDPAAFKRKRPHFAASECLRFHEGDITNFEFPDGEFSHVIHAATPASAQLNIENPLLMADTILAGTRRTLEFARNCGVKRFLLTSSGAAYGRQPSDLTHIPEDFPSSIDTGNSAAAYGEGKRMAEVLCAIYAKQFGIETLNARCFAFAGPFLPMNGSFAIGNFIRDAIEGNIIRIKGDGTLFRSYLYGADLVTWLITILVRGQNGRTYHVGSEDSLTIEDLARRVSQGVGKQLGKTIDIVVERKPDPGKPAERYVPSTLRTRTELELKETVALDKIIHRTTAWYLLTTR